MALQGKPPPMLPFCVPAVSLLIQIHANASRKIMDGVPSTRDPGTYVGELNGVHDSWCWLGFALAFAAA